jgi:serine phosphatase RsbU (regulator of sigma subunit)
MNLAVNKPSLALRILIWVAIVPSLLGEFFKIMHWPGAGLLLIIGAFTFALFYLPLFALENYKYQQTRKEKASLIAQTFVVLLFSIGFLFKIMHWPGAGVFFYFNTVLLFFIILPYSLVKLKRSFKLGLDRTHHLLLVIYFFSHTITALFNSSSGKINVGAVLQQGLNTEEALRTATSRNKQLYLNLNSTSIDKNSALLLKVNKLRVLTDSTIKYITDLKSHLLVSAENIPKTQADTLSCLYIQNTGNYDIPSRILIGSEYSLKKDKYSAYKLKSMINTYRDSLLGMLQEQNRAIIAEGLNLSTDNYKTVEGELVSWEMTNFFNLPLLHVFNTLTNIQYEIKNAEYQSQTDIINSQSKDLNTALFSQIADLNSKFESAKKQEEIEKLKGENEKGMEMLSAKGVELDETKQTIVFFILVVILFVILIFFIIRSNYLRKQTNKTLVQQKEIIESQKHLVEEKQKEIIDSISYAKRLQEAILPPQKFVNEHVAENFILYKPKDLVAGDFYWAETIGDTFFIAAADSTGHGVPGAMVSVVCSNALNRAVKEFGNTVPGKILDKTRELVLETFEKSVSDVKDGMDISLLSIDAKNKKIFWSGANNPLWYIQDNELKEIKADKQPIGKTEIPTPFTTHSIEFKTNTTFYLFTDGFADQFGGEKGKKFKYKQLSDLFVKNNSLSQKDQKNIIDKAFEDWRGDLEQVDDVCVIGIKI